MNLLTASRREVLGTVGALLGMAFAPRSLGAPTCDRVSFILDARLPEAAALAARAQAAGHRIAEPQGEMIRLLLGPHGEALTSASTIIGLTTYSDFVLARDRLRSIGRTLRRPLTLPLSEGHNASVPLLALLHDACQRRCASLATSHLWMA